MTHPDPNHLDATLAPVLRRIDRGDGFRLAADVWGEDERYPILFFHGGGQTRHSWSRTAHRLAADGWQVQCFDLRGHGESDWAPDGDYDVGAYAEDVACLARLCARPPVLVGASLGGLATLVAVGESAAPLASAVVLVDIATRMEPAGFDRISSFMGAHADGFASVEAAADAIAAYRGQARAKDLSGLRKNLRQGADQRFYWHWDPAAFIDTGIDRTAYEERLNAATLGLSAPTLLIRGQKSDLLSEEGAKHFLELAPHAAYVDVSAGHMVVGDRNDAFTEGVLGFLREEGKKGTLQVPEGAA